ncbi:SDR family oxidoreductase [Tessaracoccus terricola]
MRILVLGGTAFLSAAVAAAAVGSHTVTCAARGSRREPPAGTAFVRWDRTDPLPPELAEAEFDAVVDVSGAPRHVASAVAAFSRAHWVFVSTISVYADQSVPGGSPADTPLVEPAPDDAGDSAESYGERKVACEQSVLSGAARATIVRPGLIVGPGDPSGRFTHWPTRLWQAARDGSPVIAPLPADAPQQWVDVRDLARWIVQLLEQGTTGIFDAIGEPVPRSDFLTGVCEGIGARPEIVWLDPELLVERGVGFWAGPAAIPMWIPFAEYAGMMSRDHLPAREAGLRPRPLPETARDVLEWARTHESPPGLTREQELAVLGGRRLPAQA